MNTIRQFVFSCLLLAASGTVAASDPALPGEDVCRDQLPLGYCWTTQDVIDGRIDHHAQSALLRMFTVGGAQAADASAILCAVKRGQLEGVYLPDQGIPALRSRSVGSNWWEMIPQGSQSVCYKPPPERSPLITFRKQIKDNRDLVANALTSAWRQCGIPPTGERCYIATISKPETPDVECETAQDCVDKGLGNLCTHQGFCASTTDPIEPKPQPGEACAEPGQCNPLAPSIFWQHQCPAPHECLSIPGQRCGVCKGDKHTACIEKAQAQYDKEIEQCSAKELNELLTKCPKEFAECGLKFVSGNPEFFQCLTFEGCVLGGPSHRRKECGVKAQQKLDAAVKQCLESG